MTDPRTRARELLAEWEANGWDVAIDVPKELLVALLAELDAAEARIARLEAALRDLAEAECEYDDGCPSFGTRHGRCTGCKARAALAESGEKEE